MAISPRVEPAASRYGGSTPSSRESVSSDSPRRSRSATSRFRAAVHRCPKARGPFGVPGAAGSTRGVSPWRVLPDPVLAAASCFRLSLLMIRSSLAYRCTANLFPRKPVPL
jgi:hypothetical protein